LPATLAIFAGAAVVGIAFSVIVGAVLSAGATSPLPQATPLEVVVAWMVGLQIGVVVLTVVAAGFYASNRRETLALRRPKQGWGVLAWAPIPMFLATGAWTAFLMWWRPEVVVDDLKVFKDMLTGHTALAALAVIGIGAPLSEELLFRGFLFSGLAKSRLRILGTAVLTTALWLLAVRTDRSVRDRPLFIVAAGANGEYLGHHLLPRGL